MATQSTGCSDAAAPNLTGNCTDICVGETGCPDVDCSDVGDAPDTPDARGCLGDCPECRVDADCDSGARCDTEVGLCVPADDPCLEDAYEPNDLPGLAAAVSPGELDALTFCGNDTDFFAFTLALRDRLDLQVDVANGELGVEFLNADGQFLAGTVDVEGGLAGSVSAPRAGVYLVHVFRRSDGLAPVDYVLEARVDAAADRCPWDASEPNNTVSDAPLLGLDGEVADHTVCGDDPDLFAVSFPANSLVEVTNLSPDSLGSRNVAILSTDGTSVVADADGQGEELRLRVFLADAGTYFVRLTTETERVRYDLEVSSFVVPECDDPYEPNDSAPLATHLEDAGIEGATACLGDTDLYSIRITSAWTEVTVSALFGDAFGDIQLEVLGPDAQTILATSWTPGANETLTHIFTEPGGYHLRVSLAGGANTPYDLVVSRQQAAECPDDSEPNTVPSEATWLGEDPLGFQTLCLREDTWDFFAIKLTEPGPLVVEITPEFGGDGTRLDLIAPDGTTILRRSDGGPGRQSTFAVLDTGTYFARVGLNGLNEYASYIITTTTDVPCRDRFEPNNAAETAVSPGQGQTGDLTLCADQDPHDLWLIEILEDLTTIEIAAQVSGEIGSITMELLNADGETVLATASEEGDDLVIRRRVLAGTYYARVSLAGEEDSAVYSLSSRGQAFEGCPDEFEPNDSWRTATRIGPGTYERLTLCRSTDSQDYYTVYLHEGDPVAAEVTFLHEHGDIALHLRDPNRRLITSDGRGDTERLQTVARETGLHAVAVTVRAPSVAVSYELTVTAPNREAVHCEEDREEPNDTAEDAAEIADWREVRTVCMWDVDYFSVTLHEGEILSADLLFDHADGDLALELRGANDARLLRSNTSSEQDGSETVQFRAREPFTGFLRVEGALTGVENSYLLQTATVDMLPVEACQDALEPNDVLPTATVLDANRRYDSLDVCTQDRNDHYLVEVPANHTVDVEIGLGARRGALGWAVITPDGETQLYHRWSIADDDETRFVVGENAGLYRIQVYLWNTEGEVNYTLATTVTPVNCENDEREPDDDIPSATPITPGTYRGQICIGDNDRFAIDAGEPGQWLQATFERDRPEDSLYVGFHDGDGRYVSGRVSVPFGRRSAVSFLIPDADSYFLEIAGDGNAFNGYEFQLHTVDCDDEFEPNDNLDAAPVIVAGLHPQLSLCSTEYLHRDYDYFAIDLVAGQQLTVTVQFTNGVNGPSLYVLDPGFHSLGNDRNGEDSLHVSVVAVETGRHAITLQMNSGITNYDLSVAIE